MLSRSLLFAIMDGWMDGWMENGYVGRQMDEYMDGSGGRTVFQQLQSQRLEYQLLQFTFGPCERHWTPNCSKWLLHLCVIWMNDYWWAAGTLHYHVKYPQVHVFISSALSVLFFIVVSNSTLFPKPLVCSSLLWLSYSTESSHCVTCISVL